MKKGTWITILIILGVLILAWYFLTETDNVDEKIVKCIASKSTLYFQTGCVACKRQESLFGENYKYLNIVDCITDGDKCLEGNITATPTWIINKEKYVGVQTVEELKLLTGC